MTYKIGGFTPQQYKAYLISADEKKESAVKHWFQHFQLSRYPALVAFINRLAYFFLHRLSVYPNNAYLLEKFKSHDFSTIEEEDQFEAVKEIFEHIASCGFIKRSDKVSLRAELAGIEKRLHPQIEEEEESSSEDEIEDKKDVAVKDSVEIEEKEIEPEDIEKEEKKSEVEKEEVAKKEVEETETTPEKDGSKTIDQETKAKDTKVEEDEGKKEAEAETLPELTLNDLKDLVEKENLNAALQKLKENLDLETEEERESDDEEFFEFEKDTLPIKEEKDIEKQPKDKSPLVDVTNIDLKISGKAAGSKDKLDTDKEEKSSKKEENLHDAEEENNTPLVLKSSDEEKSDESTSDMDLTRSATERLQQLYASLALDKEEVDEEEKEVGGIPQEVVDIITQPFPLSDKESLLDLFQGVKSLDAQRLYRKNLEILLNFEKKLNPKNHFYTDKHYKDFEKYMEKMNMAFVRAWNIAYRESDTLHAEFNVAFPDQPVDVNSDGDCICTPEQLLWISKKISERFPAIYCLAFDSRALDIYQSDRMAELAFAILVGSDAAEKYETDYDSIFVMKKSIDQETKGFTETSKTNPFVSRGSFIYTAFIGPKERLSKNIDTLKGKFENYAKTYVSDWLQQDRNEITLKFGSKTFPWVSGSAESLPKHVRNHYTKTLLAMTPSQLREEINKVYQCPLIQLLMKVYANDVDSKSLIKSRFPASFMEEIFKEELRKAKGHPDLLKAIRKTIDGGCFEDDNDIQQLADKAGVSPEWIEPLIRIRLFYIMGCLGQKAFDHGLKGLKDRTDTMFDPYSVDQPLVCEPVKRTLEFDDTLDELTVTVRTKFKGPHSTHAVAQGNTQITIGSISKVNQEGDYVETTITDLQNLRFSLYASIEQIRYLLAQVAPQTVIDDIKMLAMDVSELELFQKAKKYQAAKKEQSPSKFSLDYWTKAPFSPQSYLHYKNDIAGLDDAISKAKEFVSYLNIEQILSNFGELDEVELTDKENGALNLKKAIMNIRAHFKDITVMLGEIYPLGNPDDEEWKALSAKSTELRRLLNLKPSDYGVISRSPSSEGSRSPSPHSSDRDIDLDDRDMDDDEVIIGKKAGTAQKTWGTQIWDYTLGTILNESSEVKFFQWKIERYEDLIKGVQQQIIKYVDGLEYGGVDKMIAQAKKKSAPAWMQQLLPILQFCRHKLREDVDRLNPQYLEEVRKSYSDDMLQKLRIAADWSKTHPQMDGAEHIDAICYQLYTALDINERCEDILQTFLKLGEEALKKKGHSLPVDPRFAMIKGLREAHEKIKAVPNDAKAPLAKQWANSARGHLNGIMGVTSFDPNMQSNPMHVLFHKIIKTKDASKKEATKQVKCIAMGSPTIETGLGKPEINPEFQGCMRYYKAKGLKHTYINNQDYVPRAMVNGNESPRCVALHGAAENDFKGTLTVITLSQNSSFYQQVGHQLSGLDFTTTKAEIITQLLDRSCKAMGRYLPAHMIKEPALLKWMEKEMDHLYSNQFKKADHFEDEKSRDHFVALFHESLRKYIETNLKAFPAPHGEKLGYTIYNPSAANFKEHLIAQMFGDRYETGNCIPDDLVQDHDLRTWSEEAVDQIHKHMFNGRKNLTVEERRIFTRLFYQNLTQKVLIVSDADSYNESCKDRIDRGAATGAEGYAYAAVLEDRMNDPEVIKFFETLVFARAIIVRKRTIIEERLERLIETVAFMIEHQKKLQALHAELFPDVKITIDQLKCDDDDEWEEVLFEGKEELAAVAANEEDDLY